MMKIFLSTLFMLFSAAREGVPMKILWYILSVFLVAPTFAGASVEKSYAYKAVFLQRPASIVIDGDLSDWENLDVEVQVVGNFCSPGRSGKFSKPSDSADLSANFRCLADLRNFYVAVEVRDDTLIFGEESFGEAHEDDSVEVYFDGDCAQHVSRKGKSDYDANDAEIRFSVGKEGKTRLEGMGLFGGRLVMLPGLWESLGIRAAIKRNPGGYTAELKVPKIVFVSVPLYPGGQIGFNVMVNDDDDGGKRDSKVSWTADLLDQSWLTTKHFGRLLLVGRE